MHHPIDRITYTTSFITPVVEHWLNCSLNAFCNSNLLVILVLCLLDGNDCCYQGIVLSYSFLVSAVAASDVKRLLVQFSESSPRTIQALTKVM